MMSTVLLLQVSEELEKLKQEMEEKGSSMSDGGKAPDSPWARGREPRFHTDLLGSPLTLWVLH